MNDGAQGEEVLLYDIDVRVGIGSEGGWLVVGCFEGEAPPTEGLSTEVAERVRALAGREGWTARSGRSLQGREGGWTLEIRGLGARKGWEVGDLEGWLRGALGGAEAAGAERVSFLLPEHLVGDAEEVGRRLALTRYRFDRFQREVDPIRVGAVELVAGDEAVAAAWQPGLERARIVARAVVTARDLGNTPPNEATPAWMAEQIEAMAASIGAEVEVLGPAELESRGMGGLLAVGGGSRQEPRLVRVTWRGGDGPTIALVGKGVTFDTGGISIKPGKGMHEMKYDKCGACGVVGAVQAIAGLACPVTVVAYLPLAENMPDGAAYRPGDIVRCFDGTTVEIENTDAEGRMILADALAWAASEGPDLIVDFATLTGACVVALGERIAGLYTADDALAEALLAAASGSGEGLWRMPLHRQFAKEMKGTHADLKNLGGRWGGANTAAAFLSRFVADHPRWAHLDIAGPAARTSGEGPLGATGYGVATVARWVRSLTA